MLRMLGVRFSMCFFFNAAATPELYTLSLHDALPISPGRYIDAMEKIGATDLNGTTNTDRTNYFEDVPTNALDYTLWMESDRMGHLLGALDQKTLDLQRGVVQNEKRQGENQPYGVTRELIAHNTYPAGHPY